MSAKFGQLLLFGNLITEDQLERALKFQEKRGGKLGEVLHRLGYIAIEDVTRTLGMKYGVPVINLDQTHVEQEVLKLVPAETARGHRILPIGYVGSAIACAMEDPTRIDIIESLEFRIGRRVQPVLVTEPMMTAALDKHYPQGNVVRPTMQSPDKGKRRAISEITHRIQQLPAAKLKQVQNYLDSIA